MGNIHLIYIFIKKTIYKLVVIPKWFTNINQYRNILFS